MLGTSAKSRALNCTKSKCRKQEQNISLLKWFLDLGKLLWDPIKPLEQASRASDTGQVSQLVQDCEPGLGDLFKLTVINKV